MRHRALWKKRVKGGVATVEITNIGNGWHPHMHAVIDCSWLADVTPPWRPAEGRESLLRKCKAAAIEVEVAWSKCLGQPTSSIKIKRAHRDTIAKEVLKYTIKTSDLLASVEPIGDMIRALEKCRLMTTFGSAHGQCVKGIRQQCKDAAKLKRSQEVKREDDRCTCGDEAWEIDFDSTREAVFDTGVTRGTAKAGPNFTAWKHRDHVMW